MKNFCLGFIFIVALAAHAATIPTTNGTALDGHAISLPHDLSPHATILILGFSQHSQDPTTAWEKAVRANLASPAPNSDIAYFDIPFIEDAPSFMRPLILRGIRRQVPDPIKPHFLPLTNGEAAWKQAAQFTPSAPDAAYVLLVDNTGAILWQTHDSYSPTLFAQLSVATHKLSAARN